MPKDAGDIIDDVTRKVHVLSEKCSTCIFRPGNLMYLGEGQLQEIIQANVERGALLTCHDTLPYGDHKEFGPAACRGFWDSHGEKTIAGTIAKYVIGIIEVEPPEDESEQVPSGREAAASGDRHEQEEAEG